MNEKTEGLVIGVNEVKENDAIITVLSKDYGKLSLYVKGFKKITSKNVYACQLFDDSEFLFDLKAINRVQILKSASLIEEFANIKKDYDRTVMASFCVEAASRTDNMSFAQLQETLMHLNENRQPFLAMSLYLSSLLRQNGIAPNVNECVGCGSTEQICGISVEKGGFICTHCKEPIDEVHSAAFLKGFRFLTLASIEHFDKLSDYGDPAYTALFLKFWQQYASLDLKTLKSFIKLF